MSLTVPNILKYLSIKDEQDDDSMDAHHPRAKKRRLDHLSWEEKQERKKLKNRVAAQTSRDRKKARMEQMEVAVQELFLKNEALLEECRELKTENKRLSDENAELHGQLQQKQQDSSCNQNRPVECDNVQNSGSTESDNPLPKGLHSAHSATRVMTARSLTALWKIVLACLLYRTYSANSTETTSTLNLWSNLHRVSYKISPQTWKQLLRKQIVNNQQLIQDEAISHKWWGPHQNTWTPIDTRA